MKDITEVCKPCGCVTRAGFHVHRCEAHPIHPDYLKYASEEDPRCTECGQPWLDWDKMVFHRCVSQQDLVDHSHKHKCPECGRVFEHPDQSNIVCPGLDEWFCNPCILKQYA